MEGTAPNNNSRLALIVFAVCVALIVFTYFIGRSSGKNKATADRTQEKALPNNGQGIPAGWSPEAIVTELFDAMDGLLAWSSTRENAYTKLTTLTKDQLVAVYNRFNQLHSDKDNGSLYQWIKDEAYSGPQQAKAMAALEMNGLG